MVGAGYVYKRQFDAAQAPVGEYAALNTPTEREDLAIRNSELKMGLILGVCEALCLTAIVIQIMKV